LAIASGILIVFQTLWVSGLSARPIFEVMIGYDYGNGPVQAISHGEGEIEIYPVESGDQLYFSPTVSSVHDRLRAYHASRLMRPLRLVDSQTLQKHTALQLGSFGLGCHIELIGHIFQIHNPILLPSFVVQIRQRTAWSSLRK